MAGVVTLGAIVAAFLLGDCLPGDDDDDASTETVAATGDRGVSGQPGPAQTPPTATSVPQASSTSQSNAATATSEATPAATATPAPSCVKEDGRAKAAEALVPLSTVVLRITEAGSTVREFTYDEFADFSFDCIDLRGVTGGGEDDQSGPLLTDLLAAAGYSSWTSIEIIGLNAANNDVALTATASFAEVSQGWLVTIDKPGQVRFPDPRGSSRADWVAAISEIAVTP